MLECPICRRSYEGRFQVFVPPHHESFDTVTCARRAAEAWGWNEAGTAPIILPTIEAVHARPEPQVATVARRRGVALAGFELASSQAALATGVGLLAAGAAASIYLGFRPGETAPPLPIAAGAPATRQTIGPPPAATRPAATGSPRTRPAAKKVSRPNFVASRGTGRSAGIASGARAAPVIANSSPGPAPSTSPAESPPADTPKPRPSTPKAPPATPKPPTPSPPPPEPSPLPVNPTGLAEASAGGGGIGEAGNPSSQSPPPQKPPPEKPPPQTTPPPQTPPPQTTPPSDETAPEDEGDDDEQPSDTRPGHGWGDGNHEHTGPPGQGNHGNGNGGGNGNGHGH